MTTRSPLAVSLNVEGAVYEVAMALEPEDRQAFLERVFADDAEGFANMEVLLENSGESSAYFLEASERRSDLASEILGGIL